MFQDRTDAGRQLADLLDHHDVEADVVLGIPRGGLPVARPVADGLDVPLDVVVASKIGAPDNPELAIGAVASDGSVWRNDDLLDRLGVEESYVERERESEVEAARRKLERYRGTTDLPDLDGKRVLVVDDGLATGATTIAALRQVRAAGASHVVLAVPVGSPSAIERLLAEADDVVAVETPPHFDAVGQFYRSFGQVTDDEAMSYLER
ncbi:phosphoribosyltransferase [Halorussus sp. MSC15.2]|uniref:phosphoribosyltransferase n=1 Tax=Halorussus sp. MSC15.2 TaxID=2283638 RepID=UPI0013D4F704|nr:phosphoribosyltransferase family protein [Halorussus sp. MSC15.2]NEU58074.1 phosphoribosyltransferase [Halorussus sp. MSC15.2]